jgi:Ran GTPase-activating protein (RanGAP) involved in mRNA processing and transport
LCSLHNTQINLARRNLGPADALLIAKAIRSNLQLSILKLCYNALRDEGAITLAKALKMSNGHHHRALSVLDLGFNEIGDSGCQAIAFAGVAGNYNLQSLYLTGNRIGEKGAIALARAFLHGTGIVALYVSANCIQSTGMAALAVAVTTNDERLAGPAACAVSEQAPTRRMQHLHLSDTHIGQEGFESVAGLVLSTASLKTLCLSGNNIDDQDMMLLSHALAQNKSIPLETIRLGYNHISCQGVECFMNAVWGSLTLKEIMLNHNKIKDRGAQLCAVVLTSISLVNLDISFNRISTVGIKALMKNLSENGTLGSLSLCGIPIDLNASKAVSYALAYNTSLRELYLDNCSTGYSTQRHIVAGVVSNRRSSLSVLTGFAVGCKFRC